jgi:hypothetical protein
MGGRIFTVLVGSSFVLSLAGCGSDDATGETVASSDIPASCDPIDPNYCGFPMPSSFHMKADSTTVTGLRVNLVADGLPVSRQGGATDPSELNQLDGFSPGIPFTTVMPGATLTGLAGPNSIEASMAADSPTVIINAETGERIPHFVDLDQDGEDGNRAMMVRPVVRLDDATRYIVAIRGVKDASGNALPASEAFTAFKTGAAFGHESIEPRRAAFAEIFAALDGAGVAKNDLQIAWDFTTASRENTTGWLVHMRDEGLKLIDEAEGPLYTIDTVTPDSNEHTAFQIEGTISVPLFVDEDKPGAKLLFGDDGMPEINADSPWHDVPFLMLIPNAASAEAPAKLVIYGHGLLGERGQIRGSDFPVFMDTYNYSFIGVDLAGMSSDGDEGFIANTLGGGEFHNLARMFDRMHQGTLNHLALMRIISTRFIDDADYGTLVTRDADERYYHGISQGGIFGGVFMSVATDVTRGVLGVMGQPYSILLDRSKDFDPFKGILTLGYPIRNDQTFLLNLAQSQWDRVEPNGYTPYIRENMLPGTPAHQVLMRAALGDHQVSTVAAHVMARSIGVQHIDAGGRDVWGFDKVESTPNGESGYIEYDFGLPEDPICNTPMRLCDDPHGKVRKLEASMQQMDHFFQTGEIQNFCEGKVCSFTDLSGCPGDKPEFVCAEQ